ncbi:MAG: hypothetical protein R3B13_14050 [Polyangiaceae bacterium]
MNHPVVVLPCLLVAACGDGTPAPGSQPPDADALEASADAGDRVEAGMRGHDAPTHLADAPTAAIGEVEVVSVHQLTPDGRSTSEIDYAIREPWNLTVDRIKFYEAGRLVWARIDELKGWTTDSQYLAAIHPFPKEFHFLAEWSPFPGEESVVYAAHQPSATIVSYDVDSGDTKTVASYDPGNGATLSPYIKGWTTDRKLVVNVNGETWKDGCYEIDVHAKVRAFHANASYPDPARWPNLSHGHSGDDPTHQYRVVYGGDDVVVSLPGKEVLWDLPEFHYPGAERQSSHPSWKVPELWWISDDVGLDYYGSQLKGNLLDKPHVDSFGIHQCWTDGSCKVLHEVSSAGAFKEPSGAMMWNYQSSVIATLSRDGLKITYTATDGKFSKLDHDKYNVSPWAHEKLFLLELAPVKK